MGYNSIGDYEMIGDMVFCALIKHKNHEKGWSLLDGIFRMLFATQGGSRSQWNLALFT